MPYGSTISSGQARPVGAHRSEPKARPKLPDHFFDPFLTCEHPGFPQLLAKLAGRIEALSGPRQRQRSATDAEAHLKLIAAITANLAHAAAAGFRPPLVAVPLRRPEVKRTRYEPKGFRLLPLAIELFDKAGLVRLRKSHERGHASVIRPLAPLRRALEQLDGLSLESFGHAPDEETIILARTTVDRITQDRESERIDYDDTEETIRFREEMRRINDHLARADIRYEGAVPEGMHHFFDASPRARFLHRTFNVPAPARQPGQRTLPPVEPHEKRFDRGGRLYHSGVFWQGLGRGQRRFIRIDGEPIVYLDFKSMFLRLAHIEAGIEPPPGDLYLRISGVETASHREGIKTVVNAMLFRDSPLKRLPRDTKQLLPKAQQSGAAARAAILEAFPGLEGVIEHGRGFHLMFQESQLLVALMLKLNQHGITVLPVHDGLMVAASRAHEAEALIGAIVLSLLGVTLPLERK